MKIRLQEDLMISDLEGLVVDTLLVGLLERESDDRDSNVIFVFTVLQAGPAIKLGRFLEKGKYDVVDIEAAQSPDENGNYSVSVIIRSQHTTYGIMDDILRYITDFVNINKWFFKTVESEEIYDWNRENFNNYILELSDQEIGRESTHEEHYADESDSAPESVKINQNEIERAIEKQLSGYGEKFIKSIQEEIESITNVNNIPGSIDLPKEDLENIIGKQLSQYNESFIKLLQNQFLSEKNNSFENNTAGPGRVEFEDIIERQLGRYNESFINSFQEQIQSIKTDNEQLSKYISDLKSDQKSLYDQLELYQKREKMALLREQEDFKRIKALENQLALLAPPESNKMEIIIPQAVTVKNISPTELDSTPTKDNQKSYNETNEISIDENDIQADVPSDAELTLKEKEDSSDADITVEDSLVMDEKEHENVIEDSQEIDVADSDQEYSVDEEDVETITEIEEYDDVLDDNEKIETEFDQDKEDFKTEETAEIEHTEQENVQNHAFIAEQETELDEDEPKQDDKSSEDQLSDQYFADAMRASENKEYSNAIKNYLKVIELLPDSPPSYFNLSVLYYRLKEYENANLYAQKAYDLGAKTAKVILDKAKAKLEIEKNKRKSGIVEEPSDEVKNNEELQSKGDAGKEYFSIGLIASEHKEYLKAIEYFSKSLEFYPKSPLNYLNLAILYSRINDYDTARKNGQQALKLGAKPAQRVLSIIDEKINSDGKLPVTSEEEISVLSIEEYEEISSMEKTDISQEKDPKESGDISDAEKIDKGEIEKETDFDTLSKDEIDTAKEKSQDQEVEQSGKETPKETYTVDEYFAMGLEASDQQDFRKAIEYFMQVTILLPNASPSYFNLANLHLHLNNYESAKKYAKRAIDLGAKTAELILEEIETKQKETNIKTKPEDHVKTNEEDKAPAKKTKKDDTGEDEDKEPDSELEIRKVTPPKQEEPVKPENKKVEKIPDAAAEKTKGSIEEKQPKVTPSDKKRGNKEAAKKYFLRAITASGEKKYENAIRYFTKVIHLSPKAATSYINLAVLYYRMKEYETAILHAKKALELGDKSAEQIISKINKKIDKHIDGGYDPEAGEMATEEVFIWGDEDFDGIATFTNEEIQKYKKSFETKKDVGEKEAKEENIIESIKKDELIEKVDKILAIGLRASEDKNIDKAIKCFKKVIELKPDSARGYFNLAVTMFRKKEYEKAEKFATKALDLGSKNANQIIAKIDKTLNRKKVIKKKPKIKKLKVKKEKTPIEYDLDINQEVAGIEVEEGKEEDKKREVKTPKAKKSKPKAPEVNAETKTKNRKTKPEPIEKSKPKAQAGKAKTEKPGKSKSESEGEGKELTIPKDLSVNEYFALGLESSEKREYNMAIEYFKMVTKLLPTAPPSFLNLANLYFDINDLENAKEYAEKAFDLGSQSAIMIIDKIEAVKVKSKNKVAV